MLGCHLETFPAPPSWKDLQSVGSTVTRRERCARWVSLRFTTVRFYSYTPFFKTVHSIFQHTSKVPQRFRGTSHGTSSNLSRNFTEPLTEPAVVVVEWFVIKFLIYVSTTTCYIRAYWISYWNHCFYWICEYYIEVPWKFREVPWQIPGVLLTQNIIFFCPKTVFLKSFSNTKEVRVFTEPLCRQWENL